MATGKYDTNYYKLAVHCVLLIVSFCVCLINAMPDKIIMKTEISLMFILILCDFLVQTLICYICWTMGSSSNLRKFNFKIVRNVNGLLDIRFELKEEYDDHRQTSLAEEYHDC